MSDFNGEDFDFAVGAIKGLRSWKADDQGRLRGVTYPAVWLPDENLAVCKEPGGKYEPCPKADDMTIYFYGRGTCSDPTCTPRGHFVAASETHAFDAEHGCGFWAYDEHHFNPHGDVVGVIEGYGKTTIGTKGFRCEKARIVALCREDADGDDLSLSLWLRLKQLYPSAEFFEDYDDMVMAHRAVLMSWDEPDEDFWNVPAESAERKYAMGGFIPSSWQAPAITSAYHQAMKRALGGLA